MFNFEKEFENKIREKFPAMYAGKIFDLERFCLIFPKSAEKITKEILKERENNANSRKADN